MSDNSDRAKWTELLAGAVVFPIVLVAWPVIKIIDFTLRQLKNNGF